MNYKESAAEVLEKIGGKDNLMTTCAAQISIIPPFRTASASSTTRT